MDRLESLIRWIIAYSVSGGFWHFIGCWLILGVLTKTLWFVRVSIAPPKEVRKTSKPSGDEV